MQQNTESDKLKPFSTDTVTSAHLLPVCEPGACADPEPQAAEDLLYCYTVHPRHHRAAKVDLSQTQIQ